MIILFLYHLKENAFMDEYLVPAGYGFDEFIEKRSRFIGSVWRCDSESEALGHISEMNELHRGAAHNVYAYIIRDNNIMRYSDNGEPQGTAGIPVLEVLRRENVTNVCCVVTRYFGGILLGAGGLVRAYSHSAKIALDAAGIAVMRKWTRFIINLPYSHFERIKSIIEENRAVIENTDYGESVGIRLLVPSDLCGEFVAGITNASAGAVLPEKKDEVYLAAKRK
jgi:uncharacterized YigZ family protein